MTDLGMVNKWIKPLMDRLSQTKKDELCQIVSARSAPPPTGEQLDVHIFHHVRGLAKSAGMPDDPSVVAEAITRGELQLS